MGGLDSRRALSGLSQPFTKSSLDTLISSNKLWQFTSHVRYMRIILKLTTRIRWSVSKRRTESVFVLMRLVCEFGVPFMWYFFIVAHLNSYERGVNFLTGRAERRRRSKAFLRRKSIARLTGERLTGMMRKCVVRGVVLTGRFHLEPAGTRVMVKYRFHCLACHHTRITLGPIDLVTPVTFVGTLCCSFSIHIGFLSSNYSLQNLFSF